MIAATITEVVMLADEEPSSEAALRIALLQLELNQVQRELRDAERTGDRTVQGKLSSEQGKLRDAIGHVMGETP
jgi:hypothetical protein